MAFSLHYCIVFNELLPRHSQIPHGMTHGMNFVDESNNTPTSNELLKADSEHSMDSLYL